MTLFAQQPSERRSSTYHPFIRFAHKHDDFFIRHRRIRTGLKENKFTFNPTELRWLILDNQHTLILLKKLFLSINKKTCLYL